MTQSPLPPQDSAAAGLAGGESAPAALPEPVPPPLPEFIALAAALERSLAPDEPDALRRQADMLDRMFARLVACHLPFDAENGYAYKGDWIRLALQIQKQCADTLRAAGVIDYMRGLTHSGKQ